MKQGSTIRRWGWVLTLTMAALAFGTAEGMAGSSFHIAANVTYGAGNGSLASPWHIQYALYQPPVVHPGDTLWVHGGTYTNDIEFYSGLNGTPQAPIIVRNYNNERATLVLTGINRSVICAVGTYVWYWGLELTTSSVDLENPNDGIRFVDNANYNRVINCVVHDMLSVGVADQGNGGTTVYGSILYYNGRKNTSNHGYNVYCNDPEPPAQVVPKVYRDNISFNAYGGYLWHMYTQGGQVDSLFLSHNVSFSTLNANAQMYFRNDTISGCRIDSNYWYGNGTSGYLYQEGKPSDGTLIRGNYFMRGQTAWRDEVYRWHSVHQNNTYYGDAPVINGPTVGTFDTAAVTGQGNVWYIAPNVPTKNTIIVRRNEYEAGRGHIIVYNWESKASVSVNVTGILSEGSTFQVRDAQDYYGTPVASGTVQGGMVTIPMTGTAISAPMSHYTGAGEPKHTDSHFGVFVLTGGSGTPPPPSGTFAAAPDTLPAGGGSATLTWTSANATAATVNQGVGSVALSGSRQVTVTGTTTFTLSLTGAGGSAQLTATVVVRQPVPTGTFTVAPDTLPAGGGSATLTWTSANATAATVNQGVGNVALSGSHQATVTGTTTFTLSLTGAGGSTQLTATVAVRQSVPTGTLAVVPDTLPAGGGQVQLTWTSANATAATLNQGIGTVAVAGTRNANVTASTSFVLTLTGPGGSLQVPAAVVVRQSPPAQPVAVAPANGAANQPTSSTLRWRRVADADAYGIAVSPDSLFATTVYASSSVTDTAVQVGSLVNGGTYYWRVRAHGAAGWGEYAPTRWFGVIPPLPVAPAVVAPAAGASDLPVPVQVRWTRCSGASKYRLQLAGSPGFSAVLRDTLVTDSLVVLQGLQEATQYYYRVQAQNVAGDGPYCAARSFTTEVLKTTGVAGGHGTPAAFALKQNYPNPFNPSTMIAFDLPSGGRTVVEVFALTGALVATLMDAELPAGTHQVAWSPSRQASGVYLYRIRSGNFSAVRRLTLVR